MPNQYGWSWEWVIWMGWVGDMNGVDGVGGGRCGCEVADI